MDGTSKYLIHADITAAGVVERSDVVGAVFGQTEGLLGDELDLRDLQDSQKVGRIDVEIHSEGGRSQGSITVASGLDRVETAILSAALETIEQVGPCQAEITVTEIEDRRSAKRREIVDRATELLTTFDEQAVRTEDIVERVRQRVRVADITTYEGLPAGPNVAGSDAIVVVEGRADVLQLLQHGVKNAIAVEGTDVPDAVAALTTDRTVTAFLDGDRGGDLILEELAQVGDVDYVAAAPPDQSVEDLSRETVMAALRDKVPYDQYGDDETHASPADTQSVEATSESDGGVIAETTDSAPDEVDTPTTLSDHIDAVITAESGTVRLLDSELTVLAEGESADAVSLIEECETTPQTAVIDATCSQKLLDVAAQCGVETIVAATEGQYVKQPTSVRVRTA
jgi:DNA primase